MKYLLPFLLISCTPQVKELKGKNSILLQEIIDKDDKINYLRLENSKLMLRNLKALEELKQLRLEKRWRQTI
jgi:hypothetical protein